MYVAKTALLMCPIASRSRKRTCSECTKGKPSMPAMLAAPLGEELPLALGVETDLVVPPLFGARPGERVAHRLVERAEGQAGGARTRDVGLLHVRPLGVAGGEPERQLHPLTDLVLEQEGLVDPGEGRVAAAHGAAALEHVVHRQAVAGGVERAARALLGNRDEPGAEIADVDELDGPIRAPGREHLAA